MQHRIQIDHVHSLAICTEIGDRLHKIMSKDQSELPASIEARLSRLHELEVDSPSIVPPMEALVCWKIAVGSHLNRP